jgi:hypothetical protein
MPLEKYRENVPQTFEFECLRLLYAGKLGGKRAASRKHKGFATALFYAIIQV